MIDRKSGLLGICLIVFVLAMVVTSSIVGGEVQTQESTALTSNGQVFNVTFALDDNRPNTEAGFYISGVMGDDAADLQELHHITVIGPEEVEYDCNLLSDSEVLGIDRNNDDPGRQTDESALGNAKGIKTYRNEDDQFVLTGTFYHGDDFGESIYANHTDQLLAGAGNCITHTSPGWYRLYGHENGTDWDGEYAEFSGYSSWYYICNCSSYEEAEETLGAPPSRSPGEPMETDGKEGTRQQVDKLKLSASGESEATPTSSKSNNQAGTPTAAPGTPTPGRSTATSTKIHTEESTPTDTDQDSGPETTEQSPTANSGTTPTAGSGPGFGILMACVSIIIGLIIARSESE